MRDFISKLRGMDRQKALSGAVLALAVIALSINLAASWSSYGGEPLREAASRSLFAERSSFFYDSGLAEPVPVAALKLGRLAGVDPDLTVRVEGQLVFCLVFLFTVLLLKRDFGWDTSFLAAFFIGINPYMGYYALQGSSQLYALLFLLLFWYYLLAPGGGRRSALLAGLYGGLACLSRLDAAWALLILTGLALASGRGRSRFKEAGLALGLALLLTLPYLAFQKAAFGGPLFAQELGLRRWANVEAYGYAPGLARPQGPLGLGAFLFRHGPAGPLADSFRGLGHAAAYDLPRVIYQKALMVLVFLGLYASFARRNYRLLLFLAAALLPVLPLAAIAQVPSRGGIELRYYLWTFWALCALAAYGLQSVMEWLETEVAGRQPEKAGSAGKDRYGQQN